MTKSYSQISFSLESCLSQTSELQGVTEVWCHTI